MPVAMGYIGLSEEEALEKVRTADLSETCAYVTLLETYVDKFHQYEISISKLNIFPRWLNCDCFYILHIF